MFQITEEEAAAVEKATRSQSGCGQWFQHRQMRLTASVFGDVCHRTVRRDHGKMCANIFFSRQLTTHAVIHGRTHEADALKAFASKTGLRVVKCGLFISIEHPYLAATPDGLVGTTHVIEVKCPFKGRNEKVAPGKAFPFLEYKDGALTVKQTHKYFDQVQGQMAITKRPNAYFIVFTFVDLQIIELQFDECLWSGSMLPKLQCFYENHFRRYVSSHL
jgi:hypothetical protein